MNPLFILASLLGNAVLAALFLARPTLAPSGVRDFFSPAAKPAASVRVAANAPKPPASPRPPLWTVVHSEDPRTYVARLRAAGFPPAIIRALVAAEINARYEERMRALQDPEPDAPFWKMRSNYFMPGDKRLEEMNQLARERAKILRDLFADDYFASDDVTAAQRRQFGNLSRSAIDAVQRIEDDYTEMSAAVRASTNGILLAEDREKLALLAREKHADLAAVLSPAELADYEMRTSPTTNALRSRLAGFDANEAEFRTVFQAQQSLNEKFPGSFGSVDYETRLAAQRAYEDQLRTGLGEARYADFRRETSNDFQQLSRLAQRDNLPREVTVRAYALRESAAQESNRIFDHSEMSVDDKRAALQTLAQTTRAQLLATLGPAVGPEYVKTSESWLSGLERGSAVSFARNTSMVVVGPQGTMSFTGGPEFRRLPGTPPPGR